MPFSRRPRLLHHAVVLNPKWNEEPAISDITPQTAHVMVVQIIMFPSYFSTRLSFSPVGNDQSQVQCLIEMSKILHTFLGIVDFLEPLSSFSVPIQRFLVVVVFGAILHNGVYGNIRWKLIGMRPR